MNQTFTAILLASNLSFLSLPAMAVTYTCTNVQGDLLQLNPTQVTVSEDLKTVTSVVRQGLESSSILSRPLALNEKTALGTETICSKVNPDKKAHGLICDRHETAALSLTVRPLSSGPGMQIVMEESSHSTTSSVVSNCL